MTLHLTWLLRALMLVARISMLLGSLVGHLLSWLSTALLLRILLWLLYNRFSWAPHMIRTPPALFSVPRHPSMALPYVVYREIKSPS